VRQRATVAELVFFTGTMDCGKSTLALQMHHNHRQRGLSGLILARHDRAGTSTLSSRLGLQVPAVEVDDALDVWGLVVDRLTHGSPVDYVIADETQFYAVEQVDDLARVADDLDRPVFAFGILTDFRARLFPGSARLVELADRVETLQVQALCWCGARATHNARTVDGVMVVEGEQVVVGDLVPGPADAAPDGRVGSGAWSGAGYRAGSGEVTYEVLCRAHHRSRTTAASARAAPLSSSVLPFG
jgi:thymidine kinase